mgnify:CR=1 FL=1
MHSMRRRSPLGRRLWLAGSLFGLCQGTAQAADAAAEPALEEIIVTAERRAVSLQQVPIAITAFGGAFGSIPSAARHSASDLRTG